MERPPTLRSSAADTRWVAGHPPTPKEQRQARTHASTSRPAPAYYHACGDGGRYVLALETKNPPERGFRLSGRRDSNSGPLVPQTGSGIFRDRVGTRNSLKRSFHALGLSWDVAGSRL